MKTKLLILTIAVCAASPVFADIQYVDTMPPTQIPELVYWFWHSNTLANAQYLNDVDNMAANSAYTLTFLTEREGVDFYDYKTMHEPFAEMVREAHKHHIKVGLQLWNFWSSPHQIPTEALRSPLTPDQAFALVTEGEAVLDVNGHANYSDTAKDSRFLQPFHSDVLKVFAFRKTADGYYADGSLTDITAMAKTVKSDASKVDLSIDATNLAGYTAYVMVAHYYNWPDLFNDVVIDCYRNILEHYADIPFDGTALDEFGNMSLTHSKDGNFRERFYGRAFAAEFQRRTGTPLARELFDMRFAPEGKREVRIRAINEYFDVMRDGPLRVEKAFYKMSKEIFGPNTFAGIHDTYHNYMRTDDVWTVGFNWWINPRDYGQSDENWPQPQRMGLLLTHRGPVTFDQYYSRSLESFLQKAFYDARFDGRVHYHGWNDNTGRWGIDLSDTKKYSVIRAAELKIRLLNNVTPAPPKLSVLVVFGMPALIDWFPDENNRSLWDINNLLSTDIESKTAAIWHANYPCALLPSDFIDNGQITYDHEGHPIVNGHRFDCMVFLYPQYAKETTLRFLDRFTKAGGKLMVEGNATSDFYGNDITERFEKITARAMVQGFDVGLLPILGAQTNPLADGAFMEDGSVVFTDFQSWHKHRVTPFSVNLNGQEFSGSYLGVCALKANDSGDVEKFACGGFTELKRDGKVIFSLQHPADVVMTRMASGDYDVTIVGSKDNHFDAHPKATKNSTPLPGS